LKGFLKLFYTCFALLVMYSLRSGLGSGLTKQFGALVEGVDLSRNLSDATVNALKRDLYEHRLLIFRGQGEIKGSRQVEISEWFGEVESTFSKHPRSPHPDIFRVSNDAAQGCTSVGRSGWHIDGTFMERPFKVQTMHFWACPKEGGSTLFAPLREIAESLRKDASFEWDRLHFVTNRRTDYALVHPLICVHPVTGDATMVFHLGRHFMDAIVEAGGTENRVLSEEEVQRVCTILKDKCEETEWCLDFRWQPGDFAIVDNRALAHYAHSSTQADPRRAGLRILHRTTVAGDCRPVK